MANAPGLSIGPMDIDRAGELVGELGVHNRANHLLNQHAQLYPLELVQKLSLPRDHDRSEALDLEDVERELSDLTGRRAFFKDGFVLEDAAVKGDRPGNRVVSVVFTNPESGRTGRGIIPYSGVEKATERRLAALKELRANELRAGRDPGAVTGEDVQEAGAPSSDVEARLEALEQQLAAAEARAAEAESQLEAAGDPEPWEGYDEADADSVVAKVREGGVQEFGRAGLERIGTYEGSNKGRVTVQRAVDEELSKPDDRQSA